MSKPSLAELLAKKASTASSKPQDKPVATAATEAPKGEGSILQARIANLTNMLPADLPSEMDSLREALLANPTACLMLLPEDIGQLVKYILVVKEQNQEFTLASMAAKKPKKEPKPKKVTAMDDLAAKLQGDLNCFDF